MRRGRSEISERIDSTHHCCFLFMLLCRCCKIQLEGEREIPLRQHSLAQDKLFKQMSLWLRQTNTKSAYYGSGRVAETFFSSRARFAETLRRGVYGHVRNRHFGNLMWRKPLGREKNTVKKQLGRTVEYSVCFVRYRK